MKLTKVQKILDIDGPINPNLWIVESNDIAIVLKTHNIKTSTFPASRILDIELIKYNVSKYDQFHLQCDAALESIEAQLMSKGIIPDGEKLFAVHY